MSTRYTDWVWSPDRRQFYCASYDQNNNFLSYHYADADTAGGLVSQASGPSAAAPRTVSDTSYTLQTSIPPNSPSTNAYTTQSRQAQLPPEVQQSVGGDKPRRLIKTGSDANNTETLDTAFARVVAHHISYFFICGRVFKMLWTEPAGQANPGQTRGSTHFSVVTYGENAYSEIRRFIVVNPKGTFSQCIPIQTYRNQGTLKPGLLVQDHGLVYTGGPWTPAPSLLFGEGITKQPIRVEPKDNEYLRSESRINFGKPYAVEHNVKVKEIGMVAPEHLHLLRAYFEQATRT